MTMALNIKHIVILVPRNSTLLTTVGPLEVFTKAIDQFSCAQEKPDFVYQTHVVSMEKEKLINTSSGLPIMSEGSYSKIDYPIDTLIITGLARDIEIDIRTQMLDWLREQSKAIRRICSVCSGAFILAEAGLLDGKKATAHWSKNEELAQMYPLIDVQIARIFVKDNNIYTAAGITSGMDLALALIEEDLGQSFALQVARWLVLYLKRPGNQSQFSTHLDCKKIGNPTIRKVCEWILEHLREDITVENLAEYALMSPRNFARVFVRELRVTPAKFINKLRVENASRHLIETELSLDEIAYHCGLRTGENLRRQFISLFDTTPAQYRKSFQTSLCDV
ncbi:GlxA family transcriptional regulator [Dysgonomonas sp. BGC7]|nr:GlxA family transcriptional regulator [Dysgonomonas sp. BGC7]